MGRPHIWVRHEVRRTERRSPVTPENARRLVAAGSDLTVEESPQRIFPLEDYVAAGTRPAPAKLRHRHIFFGHAFKGQAAAPALLERFRAGAGTLLDLEYLLADDGRRVALLGHDLLVHCVLASTPSAPFVRPEDVAADGRRLSLVVDVTCDTSSELNLLPVYRDLTSWQEPVSRVAEAADGRPPVEVIAIDNRPSLLPLEASRTYSDDLLPTLLTLVTEGDRAPVWARARATRAGGDDRFCSRQQGLGRATRGGARWGHGY